MLIDVTRRTSMAAALLAHLTRMSIAEQQGEDSGAGGDDAALPAVTASDVHCMAARQTHAPLRATFLHPDQLPIPRDACVTDRWPSQMVEMAQHIGPYSTLRVVDTFGGEYLYIPERAASSRLRAVVGDAKAEILSQVYGRERVHIPTAKKVLGFARRQPVVAAARVGLITMADAARMLRTTSTFMSHLVHHTNEGVGAEPAVMLSSLESRLLVEAGTIVIEELLASGVDEAIARRVAASIAELIE